jgi:hypothetical protein
MNLFTKKVPVFAVLCFCMSSFLLGYEIAYFLLRRQS